MKTKTKKSKAELRIEIAKDVLKHTKTDKIIARTGVYFNAQAETAHYDEQLQDVLPELKECEVCALGGLFYSYVKRHNNYTIDDPGTTIIVDSFSMVNLMTMFSSIQLFKIECAFEHTTSYRDEYKLADDDKALTHIMKNIIANKGTFKP